MGKGKRVWVVNDNQTRRGRLEGFFPGLVHDSFEITSPRTIAYNCIAWAMCDNDAWWWPDPYSQYFWPSEAPRENTVEAFLKAFKLKGFEETDSPEPEEGFEKIALYINSQGEPTHAARQTPNGNWTSKLGKLEDIEHTITGLNGERYGQPVIFLKREMGP